MGRAPERRRPCRPCPRRARSEGSGGMMGKSDGRPILITGGAGFIGSNLADRLAGEGHEIVVYDALARPGVERNLDWLRKRHGPHISHIAGDVRDEDELVRAAADAKAVYHFAAPPAVTTSLADPRAADDSSQ